MVHVKAGVWSITIGREEQHRQEPHQLHGAQQWEFTARPQFLPFARPRWTREHASKAAERQLSAVVHWFAVSQCFGAGDCSQLRGACGRHSPVGVQPRRLLR